MIVTFIISVSIVIFVHELGHYFFAKLLKVNVIDFSIGFGPKIFSFKSFLPNGTLEFSFRWIC